MPEVAKSGSLTQAADVVQVFPTHRGWSVFTLKGPASDGTGATGVAVVFEGIPVGDTAWVPLGVFGADGYFVGGGVAAKPRDNTPTAYHVPCHGMRAVRVRMTAVTAGPVTVTYGASDDQSAAPWAK